MGVVIAGGGIGGLSLALQLHARGIEARVCESVRDPAPLGVGILLQPAALRELERIGLREEAERIGAPITEDVYVATDGASILRRKAGTAAGYRWPMLGIHRGRLQMLLLEQARIRLGPQNVRTGLRFEAWRAVAGGVEASFRMRDGGETVTETAELLVGADGASSSVRRALFPSESAARWTGHMLYRGVCAGIPPEGPLSRILKGDDLRKLHVFSIGRGGAGMTPIHWMLDLKAPDGAEIGRAGWTARAEQSDLLPYVADWVGPRLNAPRLIQGTERIYIYPKIDRDPLPCWTLGRVTLLGDAAHATHPAGANAATQAMLDAAVLAEELERHGPVSGAGVYERRRRPDANRVLMANRSEGPERILDLYAGRVRALAPGQAAETKDLALIADNYLILAGLDSRTVNAGAARGPAPPQAIQGG